MRWHSSTILGLLIFTFVNASIFLLGIQRLALNGDSVPAFKYELQEKDSFGIAAERPGNSSQFINCRINDEYSVQCLKNVQDVYIPFTFVSKYFEVYGKFTDNGVGGTEFHWEHSHSKVYAADKEYKPSSEFMSFKHYHVEERSRVKCISGIYGVPVTTQWDKKGYFYPTQIAQYGLSHYSKLLNEAEPDQKLLEDGETQFLRFSKHDSYSHFERVHLTSMDSNSVLHFVSSANLKSSGILAKINIRHKPVVSFDIRFVSNGSIAFLVETNTRTRLSLVYSQRMTLIDVSQDRIIHGLGPCSKMTHITRDLAVDFAKGIKHSTDARSVAKQKVVRIVSVHLYGEGYLDNLEVSESAHLANFLHAANWLLTNQDNKGGWPINVKRIIANRSLILSPGWYSAMAQGQAISLLVRAFHKSKRNDYLLSAVAATKVFQVPSEDGGIVAHYMGKHVWFEEYPTTPGNYVLNGFMFSLLGLYDLLHTLPYDHSAMAEVEQLFVEGLKTLKLMLPMFDTGSGSLYDLRHHSLTMAPNVARWDYHATHVNQLLLLAAISHEHAIKATAKRWKLYMKGHRAPHN